MSVPPPADDGREYSEPAVRRRRTNQKWVTDVTEFKLTTGQKVYLSAIYDLGSGRIVSHVLGPANNNPLVFETFRQAEQTTDARNILLHSDGGSSTPAVRSKKSLGIAASSPVCPGSAGASTMA